MKLTDFSCSKAEIIITTEVNPYLDGNFRPVREESTADTLKVIGSLPNDLCGMFVRNGPNPQFPPLGQYNWFDGDGMLHGVRIKNGQASYRNRYVRTRGYEIEREAGKSIWKGIMEPRQGNIAIKHIFWQQRSFNLFKDLSLLAWEFIPRSVKSLIAEVSGDAVNGKQKDNSLELFKNTANTGVVWHAGQLLGLWEGGVPHAIEIPELETIGPQTYGGKLASAFTAHPKVDPSTGEMLFFGYSPIVRPYLHYGIVSAEGKLLRTVPIDLPLGVMMHDFAITEHYTIFLDLPLTFSAKRMQRGEPMLMFERDLPSRFGIIPRYGDNSTIRWFEAPACYISHTLNAYEDGEEVVLVACRLSSTVLGLGEKPDDPDADIPRLHQWRFNLSTGTVREEILDDVPSEFPQINEQLLGRPTQYGYTARKAKAPTFLCDALIKYDFSRGKSQMHELGKGRYGGDAVFVPRPGAIAEDDGWLVSFVYDEGKETSELVVMNAQDITASPVAHVLIPERVPYGFHGAWISEEQLSSTLSIRQHSKAS